MRDKTDFYNIVLYTLILLAFSGLLLLLHFVFVTAGDYWIVFSQFAPALTVIFLLAIRRNKRAILDVKRVFRINKKVLTYSVFAALFVFVVLGGFGFILSVFGKPFSEWEIPVLKWETPSLAISFICLTAGCISEEVGWRGFLLPALNRNLSLIVSSLSLGIFWGVGHLDFGNGIAGFLVTVLFLTMLSVIISWFQIKSGGSIIPAIALHFFVNFFARSTLFDMSLSAHFALTLLLCLFGAILFFADRKTFMSKENASSYH